MNILFIGDVVGNPGREAIKSLLPGLRKEFDLDFVVVNAENAAGGSGITAKIAQELFDSSVDVLTSGDHIWKKKEIFELIKTERRILRPNNFPSTAAGAGYGVFTTQKGRKVGVICVLGRVFMDALECPFRTTMAAVEAITKETNVILVDIHAEATSEKVALGWYLQGKVSAVLGTHTHIQTADERILPEGTAYLTDAGMTGPYDSVIGRRVEDVMERFLTHVPVRFEVAEGNIQLCGAVVEIDERTGHAQKITRIQRKLANTPWI
ncbi:MAG: TIGR00282 family metallophosphoesterase [Candidatus Omnitrophica bacterium]|nr:TIGR00282 family metallophosphoesterase [Candidatus Omnitrophota bacterium]